MIMVTRINKSDHFFINENLIEFIEEIPDTLISLESGRKVVVMESAAEVIDKIFQQKVKLLNSPPIIKETASDFGLKINANLNEEAVSD